MLSACSSAPSVSPWAKQLSPWEQRKEAIQDQVVPVAEESRSKLVEVDQTSNEVELSYQSDPMASSASVAAGLEAESTEAESVEATAVVVPGSMTPKEEILNLPADYFTVQLMASVDVGRVYKFAEQNHISVRYIVPTIRDGKIWFVLLLDVYPDRVSAKAGLNEVAIGLKTQPWIRSLGSIQKLMQ